MVEIFRRYLEEFLYPPPPNHFEPWRGAWKSITGLSYVGLLVLFKVIIVLIASYGINIIIRRRRTGGRNRQICTSILRHRASTFVLRFWVPVRLLCPSLLFELGVRLCDANDKLPRSINRAITSGLTKSSTYLEWIEIIVIASLLYCLLEGPITHAASVFGRWCAKFDTKRVIRPSRRRNNQPHSIIRVVEEPIIQAGEQAGVLTSNDEDEAISIASDILHNLRDDEEPRRRTRSTVRRRLQTTPKRVEATIETTGANPRRNTTKRY